MMSVSKRLMPILIGCLLLYLAAGSFAQEPVTWIRLSTAGDGFSIVVPSGFLVERQEKGVNIYAFSEGFSLTIRSENTDAGRRKVKESYFPKEVIESLTKTEVGGFLMFKAAGQTDDVYSCLIYAGSAKEFIDLKITAESATDPVVRHVLESILFDGKNLPDFVPAGPTLPAVALDCLNTSPEITAALERPINASPKIGVAAIKEKVHEEVYGFTRPLLILLRPRAGYTDDARRNNKQGTIKAKVVFSRSGDLTAIIIADPPIDKGLANNVVKAILGIKFIPALKDGKPVDVVRILEYGFSIY